MTSCDFGYTAVTVTLTLTNDSAMFVLLGNLQEAPCFRGSDYLHECRSVASQEADT